VDGVRGSERPDPRHRDVRPGRGRRGARGADGGGRSTARDPRSRIFAITPGQPRGHRAGHRVRDAHRREDPFLSPGTCRVARSAPPPQADRPARNPTWGAALRAGAA
jgi:hypothetical protein